MGNLTLNRLKPHLSTWVPVWDRNFRFWIEVCCLDPLFSRTAHDWTICAQPLPMRHPNCPRSGEYYQLEPRNGVEAAVDPIEDAPHAGLVGHRPCAAARRRLVAEKPSEHVLATLP